jgi:hypothetical protein
MYPPVGARRSAASWKSSFTIASRNATEAMIDERT